MFFFNKVAGLRPATLLKKETQAQVFSCEFREISKNTFFTEYLWATAPDVFRTLSQTNDGVFLKT